MFPCVLDILEQHIFNKKNPIVVGVKVHEGILQPGTPLCFFKVRVYMRAFLSFVRACVPLDATVVLVLVYSPPRK